MKSVISVVAGVGVSIVLASLAGAVQLEPAIQPGDPGLAFEAWEQIEAPSTPVGSQEASCADQLVQYGQAKSTGVLAISINNATSAQAAGQWFDAPGSVTITGATFYSFVNNPGDSVLVDVQVYLADVDRLPTGAALATETVTVDNEFGGGTFPELIHEVTFASPVVVSAPYVVVVANHSPTSIALISSDYTVGDGAGEYLASVDIFGTWLIGSDVSVGGFLFDADWIIEPLVSFEHTASFTPDPACLSGGETVTMTNSSDFAQSRFYNLDVFNGTPELSFLWDYGDGSPTENAVSPTHAYAGAGPYTVGLTATINGWNGSCVDTAATTIGPQPVASFGWSGDTLTIVFTNTSTNGDSYLWDFGDGQTSTEENPTHTYASVGSYTVCLEATNGCGTQQVCDTVGVVPVELMRLTVE